MKYPISALRRLAIVSLALFPIHVMGAATDPGTAYSTDVTNSYVQDQTSDVMSKLNGILCYMGAMAPDQMVNLSTNSGNYIALIDQNVCESKGSGGQGNNTGASYVAAIVNSSRTTTADPMNVKVWLSPQPASNMVVFASATQAPNTTTLPYGVFRMDYCGGGSPCPSDKGFIDASTNGLSFFQSYTDSWGSGTTALQLNATGTGSTAAGNGAISQTCSSCNNGSAGSVTFKFAYNSSPQKGYFVRNDGSAAGDLCFDRDPANAAESVWRYGLYDATSGAQITRKSGFPVEYVDASVSPNVTYNGYVGYYGLWMPVSVPSGSTVSKVDYSNNSASKMPFTLYSTGGKLWKYTTANKTLADLNKITFWYYVPSGVNIGTDALGAAVMTGGINGSQYELFWDNSTGQFMVSGKQNTNNYNMEPYTTPVVIATTVAASNLAMKTANPWGLFGWSQMMGGMFGIQGSDFANITSTTTATVSAIPVKTQTQNLVYPSQFPASLVCIDDCPTAALIASSNTAPSSAPTTPFINPGWTSVAPGSFYTYSLNATTGNLMDAATPSAPVVSIATSGNNQNGIRSGRMVTVADANTIVTQKTALNLCGPGVTCASFNQGDVDLLPVPSTYYVWETGANPWNQISYLMSQATPPVLEVFDAPLQVSYTVPANTRGSLPYGNFAGSTMTLQYGGFGDLWGIPNECIDVTTNTTCVFSGAGTPTPQNNQRWTPKFSIPAGGSVTPDAGVTTYLVKALDKEVRLAKVACTGTGLPATSSLTAVTLPGIGNFVDPIAAGKISANMPTFATVPAPQVIHGVKQY